MSYRWNELEETAEVEKLLEETKYIKALNDWAFLEKVNIETACIYYYEDRNKEFIQILIDKLSEKLKSV